MEIIKKDDKVYKIIETEIQYPENRIRDLDEEIAELEEERTALANAGVLKGVQGA